MACDTLGRPTRAMLTTLEGEGTKSTVMASASPGTDSVAVSPVSATSARQQRACQRAHVQRGEHPL